MYAEVLVDVTVLLSCQEPIRLAEQLLLNVSSKVLERYSTLLDSQTKRDSGSRNASTVVI